MLGHTDRDRQGFVDACLAELGGHGHVVVDADHEIGPPGSDVDPDTTAIELHRSTLRGIGNVDRDGNLWIGRRVPYGSEVTEDRCEVVDPSGRWLGTVTVPAAAGKIMGIGDDYIVTARTTDLDVPQVAVYGLA